MEFRNYKDNSPREKGVINKAIGTGEHAAVVAEEEFREQAIKNATEKYTPREVVEENIHNLVANIKTNKDRVSKELVKYGDEFSEVKKLLRDTFGISNVEELGKEFILPEGWSQQEFEDLKKDFVYYSEKIELLQRDLANLDVAKLN